MSIETSSTRKDILLMLKTNDTLSVSDMANNLGITEMAVRRHLNTLERDGYIQSVLVRQPMGRPLQRYSLTIEADHLFPKNYDRLTLELLDELSEEEGKEIVDRLFSRREKKLRQHYSNRIVGDSLQERVSQLAQLQNEKGYMVDLIEQDNGDYLLKEYNCPIASVAREYHQACHCELTLFRNLLETEVERPKCMAKGDEHCAFSIKSNKQVKEPAAVK